MSVVIAPPFTRETALAKVKAAEDAWNSRDPERVALAYTEDSEWRNRGEFFRGRDAIRAFLRGKWERELEYRLMKELWSFTGDRISVRFEYEWHDATGQWFRTHGNEHWEFDARGLMRRRDMSANDVPIEEHERRYRPAAGVRSNTDMTQKNENPAFQTGHVGINVTDLDRSLRFYQRVFGFEIGGQSEQPERRFAFLKQGDTLVLTLWQQSDGRFEAKRPGLHHLSFRVPTLADVRAAEQRVREAGGDFLYEGAVPHREGASSGGIYFEDPDGTRLEVFTSDGLADAHAPTAGAPSCGFF